MFRGGPWWIPPELPVLDEHSEDPVFDTDDEVTEQDNVAKGTLGQIAKQRLAVLLKEVTFQRGTIARAMAFAIDHSEAATEVSHHNSWLSNGLTLWLDCRSFVQIHHCSRFSTLCQTSQVISRLRHIA